MEAIDHLDLVVTSLERGLSFYVGLLGPLGYVHRGEIEGERGERVVYLSRHGGGGSVSLRERRSDAHPTPYDRHAVGIHHICFAASSRLLVDERARWLREQGAEIESGPREYGYTPGYYTWSSSTTWTGSSSRSCTGRSSATWPGASRSSSGGWASASGRARAAEHAREGQEAAAADASSSTNRSTASAARSTRASTSAAGSVKRLST